MNNIAGILFLTLLLGCQNNNEDVAESPKGDQPNIVIFLADDLG